MSDPGESWTSFYGAREYDDPEPPATCAACGVTHAECGALRIATGAACCGVCDHRRESVTA